MPKINWKKILKAVYRHPYITLGSTVGPVLAFKAITGTADKIHSTYDIASQHSQKKLLERQLELMKEMAKKSSGKEKDDPFSDIVVPQKMKASYYIPRERVKRKVRYY